MVRENHNKATELLVGFYKVGSGKHSMNWSQSVDEALCFGWIDAVRKSIDKESYSIRFSRRKSNSIWGAVNIKKIEELTKKGLMHPPRLASFEKQSEHKSKIYAYEKAEVTLSDEYEKKFKAHKKAWIFFQSLAPSYRKPATNWVMSAKQKATRIRRLNELIADSEVGKK
jgi:uncharacterized protein YdeI (YjbR/CyaY-like superfamily)